MSQQLLFPLEISFNKTDIDQIKEIKEDLESVGFLFGNILEDKIVVIRYSPDNFRKSDNRYY